jgi:glycosyltransferase involved in cell wall biosynthesis
VRVLAHIHTFNDADIIDRTIEALLRQSRPVDGILVVDNASSDATLDRRL